MTKEELLKNINYIEEELYDFIVKDQVDKYYLPTLNELRKIVKELSD